MKKKKRESRRQPKRSKKPPAMHGSPPPRKSKAARRSDEQDVLAVIMNKADKGILQSELWKAAGLNSSEGSRAILRLEKKGLVERRKEIHEKRWTYRLVAKRRYSKVDTILQVPCAFCNIMSDCQYDRLASSDCNRLTQWLISEAQVAKP